MHVNESTEEKKVYRGKSEIKQSHTMCTECIDASCINLELFPQA